MISWLTHFFYLHFTTTVSRKEVPEQYVWWWKLAFLTKWGEIICVLYSVFSFLSVLNSYVNDNGLCTEKQRKKYEKFKWVESVSTNLLTAGTALAIGITGLYILVLGDLRKQWMYYGTYRDIYWHQMNTYLSVMDLLLVSNSVGIRSLFTLQTVNVVYGFVNWMTWLKTGILLYPNIGWESEQLKSTLVLFGGMTFVGIPVLYFLVLGLAKSRDRIYMKFCTSEVDSEEAVQGRNSLIWLKMAKLKKNHLNSEGFRSIFEIFRVLNRSEIGFSSQEVRPRSSQFEINVLWNKSS